MFESCHSDHFLSLMIRMIQPGALIIFSGLPGSGKSTLGAVLAWRLKGTYLRIDTIEQGLRDICQMARVQGEGYELAHLLAADNLRLGNTVIADSVNPWPLTRAAWNEVARESGAPFFGVEVVCSDKEEHRRQVEARGPSPTWREVLDRDYRPWEGERMVIETSGRDVEECLAELLSLLQDKGLRL
jgi:predicted kinase